MTAQPIRGQETRSRYDNKHLSNKTTMMANGCPTVKYIFQVQYQQPYKGNCAYNWYWDSDKMFHIYSIIIHYNYYYKYASSLSHSDMFYRAGYPPTPGRQRQCEVCVTDRGNQTHYPCIFEVYKCDVLTTELCAPTEHLTSKLCPAATVVPSGQHPYVVWSHSGICWLTSLHPSMCRP